MLPLTLAGVEAVSMFHFYTIEQRTGLLHEQLRAILYKGINNYDMPRLLL